MVAEVVDLVPAQAHHPVFVNKAGQEPDAGDGAEALPSGDRLAEILEIDELDAGARVERDLVREQLGGEDLA